MIKFYFKFRETGQTIFVLIVCSIAKQFSKIIYKIASNIWYDIGDKSIDFNYYTKRLILYNIIKSSFFYWRKNLDLDATLVFTQDQINLFGKLGKYKSIGKSRLKEKFSFILQRKNI